MNNLPHDESSKTNHGNRRQKVKKRKFDQAIVYVVLALFFVIISTASVFAGADEAAIEKVRVKFNEAFNKGDAKAMGALLDRDAVWMPPTGEQAISGADKVVALYKAFFEKTRSEFELKPGTIQVSGQWAFLNGPWQRKDTGKPSGIISEHGGYYLLVFKKQVNGNWKIARDIWNDVRKQ
jgi:uncharacterized protein (TIGR02246 family)